MEAPLSGCRDGDTPFNTLVPLSLCLLIYPMTPNPIRNTLFTQSRTRSRRAVPIGAPSLLASHLFFFFWVHALCARVDIWELPYGVVSKTEIGLQMLRGAESRMRLAPLGGVRQKRVRPPGKLGPRLLSPQSPNSTLGLLISHYVLVKVTVNSPERGSVFVHLTFLLRAL